MSETLGDILGAAMAAQQKAKYEVTIEILYDGARIFAEGLKIPVIKEFRAWSGMGLKDSKDIVEAVYLNCQNSKYLDAYRENKIVVRMDAQRFADFMMHWYNAQNAVDYFLFDGCKVYTPEPPNKVTRITL